MNNSTFASRVIDTSDALSGKSIVASILSENWDDLANDLFPKDRRMSVLAERDVDGMSCENVRFLVNELVRRFAPNGVYLEVGMYRGCSILSAALFNQGTRCIGIDNFSEFDQDGTNHEVLKANLAKFGNPSNIEYHNLDYRDAIWRIFAQEPDLKVDVYYYDGEHTYEQQVAGLEIILPHLSERCAILVDDLNWEYVERANADFLRAHPDFDSAFKIGARGCGTDDWWNGVEVITRRARRRA
ncbi:MAG: class I SAM-dependent methyltransferase [Candidatus Coatesbacteria bacterium]|nr:class I SAM-dependent methyltransferase [Candidatus Coatesbacteria bacterium]